MHEAGKRAREALATVEEHCKPGNTTDHIDKITHEGNTGCMNWNLLYDSLRPDNSQPDLKVQLFAIGSKTFSLV